MSELVSEERAEAALDYLTNTSHEYAEATADSRHHYQALKETLVDLLRETEADGYLKAEGTQEQKKHTARTTEDYKEIVQKRQEVLDSYREAEYKRQRLESGREAARATLSMFQSMLRNQRDGM